MSLPSRNSDHSVNANEIVRRARRRPGENRQRLLEAGILAFGAHGYHGASTAVISSLAEVPQPHLYANFRTKHDLFLACARRVIDDLLKEQSALPASAGNRRTQAAFLFQCLAVSQEQTLQPELSALIREFCEVLGTELYTSLIGEHVRLKLDEFLIS